MSWDPPAEFEEYRILRPLGAGAMGQVFLAHDTLLDRAVAIKFISALEIGPAARERFFTEARAVARLSHPNVVGIHRVGEVRQRPYLVSEYIRGTSLAVLDRPLPWERVLKLALGMARGLASAHRRGVLHRDLKPANVMLGEDDEAKLLDFGLAKLVGGVASEAPVRAAPAAFAPPKLRIESPLDATMSLHAPGAVEAGAQRERPAHDLPDGSPASELTVDGAIVGTPLYLAPELWRGEPASRRSDVYALGVVLYELLAGHAPHAGLAVSELAIRAVEENAAPIETLAPNVPSRFAQVVDACVSRDPAARPESGDALSDLLEAVIPRVSSTIAGSPYRGLSTFEPEHRALFFGRADETRTVVERLRTETFVVVAGDSGAGKSSLCRAAVVPAVLEKSLAGRRWRVATMLPGARPRASLDAALASRSPDEGLLLFVDQLEELLTIADPVEAAEVAERLAELAIATSNVRVLASARSDFLGRLAGLPGLGELIGRALFLLGPLSERGLRDAIVGPARALGYEFEAAMTIDELVVSGRRHLPLLQFTLAALWDARDDKRHQVPADALARIGGVAGALARRADQVMAALGDADREIAWRVLVRLMTAEGTRAVLTRAELAESSDAPTAVARVVERLVSARLLVVAAGGDDRVEVVHEALFTGWPRLDEWRRTHERDARLRDQLAEAARQWRDRGEPRGLLWRDDALVEYRLWRGRWNEPITAADARFGLASEAEARRVRRIRLGLLAIVIAGLSAVIVMLYRADQRGQRERAEAEAQNRVLLVQQGQMELDAGRAGRALAYFVEVLARGEDTPALRLLIAQAALPASRDRGVIVREPRGHSEFAVSPDGKLLATVERSGTLRVFANRTLVFSEDTKVDQLGHLAFSPDGRWLVAAGNNWTLSVWDVHTWASRRFAVPPAFPGDVGVADLAISLDSTRVIAADPDGIARLWELETGKLLHVFGEPGPTHGQGCVGFSPDGSRAVVGDLQGVITVWDAVAGRELTRLHADHDPCHVRIDPATGRLYVASNAKVYAWDVMAGPPATVFTGHAANINAMELRGDGTELLTASSDGTAKRWNARTGELLGEFAPSPRRHQHLVRFDPTGRRIVTAGADGLFRIWDVATSRQLMVIEPAAGSGTAHNAAAGPRDAMFSRDGTTLLAGSGVDLEEWAVGSEPLLAELPHTTGKLVVRFSPDDTRLVIAGEGPAEIRDVHGAVLTTIGLPARTWDASWTPDGRRILVVGDAAMARIYGVAGDLQQTLTGHRERINHAAFRRDGLRIVTASDDHTARVWDATTGRELLALEHAGRVLSAGWTSDGLRIATAGYDGLLKLWDATTGRLLVTMGDPTTQFLDVSISPDDTKLLVAGHDNMVSIWDIATRTRERLLIGHLGPVTGAVWSPDGALVASSSDYGGVRVWDPVTGRLLQVFDPAQGGAMSLEWSHDGKRLVAASANVALWDVHRDGRSVDELRALTPWTIVNGELVGRGAP